MKRYLLLLALFVAQPSFAQVDTSYLKALYDRCLDFDEKKIDSINYYADFIAKESARLKFNKGDVLSLRLKGIYEDLSNNYTKAIDYYLKTLEAARKLNDDAYIMSALSDLAIVYSAIKDPHKAKEFYLECAAMSEKQDDPVSLVNTYNNLGVIYTQLHQYDSGRILLHKAIHVARPYGNRIDLSSVYNNLGNIYFKEKKWDEALPYFRQNFNRFDRENDPTGMWVASLNIGDVYIEKKQFDSALVYTNKAMVLSDILHSKSKEADTYSLLAKLYEYKGDYKQAYENIKKWYERDTSLLNEDTYHSIVEMQERFHAKEREAENALLQARVEKETIKTQGITLLAIALAIIGILVGVGLVAKRRANRKLQATNELIVKQNEKLSELNYEKNSLISIVSHDLNTPFATIQIWGQVLQGEKDKLSTEQLRALDKIMQASNYGEEMIRRILDVEKEDIGKHKMQLENFDLRIFTEEVIDSFKPVAARKNIQLHADLPGKQLYVLNDRQLVNRICENLLSNAIKFTPQGKNVWISISDEQDAVSIKVRDEGVGIEKDELPFLFSKYSKLSSQPTNKENSTGLGLSIVKRIVEEINGKIFCESEPGKGSLFTVILKK